MALPLLKKGHEVNLITFRLPSQSKKFTSIVVCNDMENMQEAVKIYEPITDIFHCHNEPSWFVTMVKELTSKPVILDVHDTFLTRSEPENQIKGVYREITDERNNFYLADGLNFCTDYVRDDVYKHYNLTQPSLVLPSYVPANWYQYDGLEWLGGLVYEGKVMLKTETVGISAGFNYCDYEDLAKQCTEMNMAFHIYTVRTDNAYLDTYKGIALLHEPCGILDLVSFLTRHDWGLVGNSFRSSQWQRTSSNKMFEYIAAGIPPVVMNAQWSAGFVNREEVGIVVESVEELGKRWGEHRPQRANLVKRRYDFAMENHIHELEEFYKVFL